MRFIILFAFLGVILSCSTGKKLGPVPDRSAEEILKALKKRNIDFRWFSGKVSTAMESPDESVSGSMQIRMVRDSIMWIAVKKFGIEAARLLVDKNNYTILYRLESSYESGSIAKINDVISVSATFEDIQQLMVGNVILPPNDDVQITRDSIHYIVSTKSDNIILRYYVNGYNLQLDKISLTDNMNRTAKAHYSDYRLVEGFGYVAYDRTIEFPYAYDAVATINMKFSEIEINVPKEIKFSIPDSYEKIN